MHDAGQEVRRGIRGDIYLTRRPCGALVHIAAKEHATGRLVYEAEAEGLTAIHKATREAYNTLQGVKF